MSRQPDQTLRIFISHSGKDNVFGFRLVQDLRRALGNDDAVWYDVAGGLRGGDRWLRKIIQELETRNTFIIILSQDAIDSYWVQEELTMASVKRMHIVPVLYRPAKLNIYLKAIHYVSFLDPQQYDSSFAQLLQSLELPASAPGVQSQPVPPSPTATRYHTQGVEFLKQHKLEEADQMLHTALSHVNNSAQCLDVMKDYAAVLSAQERWPELLRLSEEALQLAPGSPSWLQIHQKAQREINSHNARQERRDKEGLVLGSYQLIEWLGQRMLGNSVLSELYRAKHVSQGTITLVKVWNTILQNGYEKIFRVEARALTRLIHPNIIHVLDFGIDNGTPFLVMQPIPRESLRQRHPAGLKLAVPTIQAYVQQIASALQYAHDQNRPHGRLMPENILVGPQQELLISDFHLESIARYMKLPDSGIYMAPEQQAGRQSSACDQYALAVMVCEWLLGRPPSYHELRFTDQRMQDISIFPAPTYQQIPHAFEPILSKALNIRPQERYANIKDFADAISLIR